MSDPAPHGFADWVESRRPSLLRTAFLLCGNREDAEDLVQMTLLKVVPVWRKIADDPEPYVRRVMVHANISRWRRRRWREEPVAAVPDGVRGAEPSDDRLTLHTALQTLSPRQRAVIVLRYYDDLTEAGTAQMLGIGVGTVKSHAREGLARLRLVVGEQGEARV